MILKDTIFRAYDIRGKAFVDFDEDGFMAVAHGFGTYVAKKFDRKNPKIFVSGDGRQSMPELAPAVISGLKAAECDVVWGGAIPTPLNYFAFHYGDFDAAIQISASHNPADDNGLKLTDRNGAVSGEEIQKIAALARCTDCKMNTEMGTCLANCEPEDFLKPYVKKLSSLFSSIRAHKILIDAGNAIPGIFYPSLLREFGQEVTELFCDLNTTFPNHQPDPERPENLRFAQEVLKESPHDFACVYDGDGDRVGILLSDGTVLSADKIFYVLAADFLSRNPNESVVVDAMSSQTLIEKLKALGAQVFVARTGHSNIEHAMKDHRARIGGEQSGHFMFGEDFYGHDDALLATLRFLTALDTQPELLKTITTDWPVMVEFSERITVPDEKKFLVMEEITKSLLQSYPEASTLDGVRINFGNGEWAIIRCSNTSPKIAVRIEAQNPESLEPRKKELLGLLDRYR